MGHQLLIWSTKNNYPLLVQLVRCWRDKTSFVFPVKKKKPSLLVRWCISTNLEEAIAAKCIAKSQRCGILLCCLPIHTLKLVAFLRGFKDRHSLMPNSRIQDSTASY